MAELAQPPLGVLVQCCPATRAAILIGDTWTQLILREAFAGARRFSDFMTRLGMSRNVLTHRLKRLVANEILALSTPAGGGLRQEYVLTPRGLDTLGIAMLLDQWERTHGPEADAARPGLSYRRLATGALVEPTVLTAAHGAAIEPRRLNYRLSETPVGVAAGGMNARRRNPSDEPRLRTVMGASEVIGDYWSWTILIAAFFHARRFEEFLHALGIASNVLSDRLQRLVAANLLVRERYTRAPPRYEYRLAIAGRALHPLFCGMYGWGERWLFEDMPRPMFLFDMITGEPIHPTVCDAASGDPVSPDWIRVLAWNGSFEPDRLAV